MSDEIPTEEPRGHSRGCLGCLTITVTFAIAFAIWLPYAREQSRLALERERAESRQAEFDDVRSGQSYALIMRDAKILPMLANDADCIANLKQLDFAMVEIAPEDAAYIAKLSNVTAIYFYDAAGAGAVLEHATTLPIEELSFDSVWLSEESQRHIANYAHLKKVGFAYVNADEITTLTTLRPDIEIEILEERPAEELPGR